MLVPSIKPWRGCEADWRTGEAMQLKTNHLHHVLELYLVAGAGFTSRVFGKPMACAL